MTQEEWQNASEPLALLAHLQDVGRASPRKLRLFAVACSRRMWPWIDPLGQMAVEIAEQFADGMASPEQMRAARLACQGAGNQAAWYAALSNPAIAARNAALCAQSAAGALGRTAAAELAAQANLVREVFGNPFRPVYLNPSSLQGASILQSAQAIYEDGAFERVPELADALHEAGCHDSTILNHCRQAEPHVRGCWLLDMFLQKE